MKLLFCCQVGKIGFFFSPPTSAAGSEAIQLQAQCDTSDSIRHFFSCFWHNLSLQGITRHRVQLFNPQREFLCFFFPSELHQHVLSVFIRTFLFHCSRVEPQPDSRAIQQFVLSCLRKFQQSDPSEPSVLFWPESLRLEECFSQWNHRFAFDCTSQPKLSQLIGG